MLCFKNQIQTCRMEIICSEDGAATRTPKHRLLIAGMTRDVEFDKSISRQVATYFSIVRLRAC